MTPVSRRRRRRERTFAGARFRGFVRAHIPGAVTAPGYGVGVGRPKQYPEPRVATAVRIPVSLRDQLRAAAAERDVSANLLVTRALADYLERLPPPAPTTTSTGGRGQPARNRTEGATRAARRSPR
jgi:hypothetical protein